MMDNRGWTYLAKDTKEKLLEKIISKIEASGAEGSASSQVNAADARNAGDGRRAKRKTREAEVGPWSVFILCPMYRCDFTCDVGSFYGEATGVAGSIDRVLFAVEGQARGGRQDQIPNTQVESVESRYRHRKADIA
eukprot:1343301-Rhodomonas_salina.1